MDRSGAPLSPLDPGHSSGRNGSRSLIASMLFFSLFSSSES
jgi:hypothetical protein